MNTYWRRIGSFAHLPTRVLLTDPERSTLAVLGKRLGRRGLEPVTTVAKPETILAWFRKLVAQKFDGSQHRLYPGRPPIGRKITELIVRMARENRAGDTIASPAQWRFSAIASPIKAWATYYDALVLLLLPNVACR
jgi:hypothetical protein